MEINLLDYLPHSMVGLLAAVGIYVFQKHEKQDDKRFKYVAEKLDNVVEKVEAAAQRADDQRAEILKLLINGKTRE